jgi:hypothetical protein
MLPSSVSKKSKFKTSGGELLRDMGQDGVEWINMAEDKG